MKFKNSSISPFIGNWSRVVCSAVNPCISVLLILEELLGTKDFFWMEELLGRWSRINGSSLCKLFMWYMHFILWLAIRGKLLSPQWFQLCNFPWCCRIPYFNYLWFVSCIDSCGPWLHFIDRQTTPCSSLEALLINQYCIIIGKERNYHRNFKRI